MKGAVKKPHQKQAGPNGSACIKTHSKRLVQWKNQPFCSVIKLPHIMKTTDKTGLDQVKKNIRKYFEENGIMEQYDTLYDAKALEVIGIEHKKRTRCFSKVNEQSSQAQATSGSVISVADLLNLVKGDAENTF